MARHPEAPLTKADGEDGLDELGDDAIIAQETTAHPPQRRANVLIEQPSVVVSDPAPLVPPLTRRRGSTDKTVVIRDRRAVEEIRRKVREDRDRHLRKKKLITVSIWLAAGVIAFGLGGVFALLASRGEPEAAGAPVTSTMLPASDRQPQIVDLDEAEPAAPQPVPSASEDAVDLDELPVEKAPTPEASPRKRVRRPAAKPKPESTVYVPF